MNSGTLNSIEIDGTPFKRLPSKHMIISGIEVLVKEEALAMGEFKPFLYSKEYAFYKDGVYARRDKVD